MTADDYDSLLLRIDEVIAAHGKINLLVLIGDFEGLSDIDAAKADFKFGTHQYRQVEKAAFVGEKKWQKWAIKVMDPFTRRTDERFFDFEQYDEAWSWVVEEQ